MKTKNAMDQETARLFALLIALIISAFFLRRRYGNVYKSMTEALERMTGLSMTTIWRVLGILTLIVWGVVYLVFGGEEQTGLDRLFDGLFQAPSGEPEAE